MKELKNSHKQERRKKKDREKKKDLALTIRSTLYATPSSNKLFFYTFRETKKKNKINKIKYTHTKTDITCSLLRYSVFYRNGAMSPYISNFTTSFYFIAYSTSLFGSHRHKHTHTRIYAHMLSVSIRTIN